MRKTFTENNNNSLQKKAVSTVSRHMLKNHVVEEPGTANSLGRMTNSLEEAPSPYLYPS